MRIGFCKAVVVIVAALVSAAASACSGDTTSMAPAPTTGAGSGGTSEVGTAGGGGANAGSGPGARSGQAGSAGNRVMGSAGMRAEGGSASMDSDAGVEPNDAGRVDSGDTTQGDPKPVADYNAKGPYEVTRVLNVARGLVTGGSSALIPSGNSNDPNAFTLFYPKNGKDGETFPILTFGNGTFCSPTFYDEFIGHVVSYGFIVIATNTSNTGSGAEMLKGVDWLIEQNGKSDSPIYKKVNTEKIGAFGHSQGGAGTCRAGADPRVDAIATLSGTSDVAQISAPAFFVTTNGEAGDAPDERIEMTLGQTTKPSMYGITVGGDHDEYTDKADEGITALIGLSSNDGEQSRAAVTAWFDWQLKDMREVSELFLAKPCKFCNDKNLKRLDVRGF